MTDYRLDDPRQPVPDHIIDASRKLDRAISWAAEQAGYAESFDGIRPCHDGDSLCFADLAFLLDLEGDCEDDLATALERIAASIRNKGLRTPLAKQIKASQAYRDEHNKLNETARPLAPPIVMGNDEPTEELSR